MTEEMDELLKYRAMLEVALQEAKTGRDEGGIPIGAALFDGEGRLLASGRKRRVQEDDPFGVRGDGCVSTGGAAAEL